MNVAAKLGHIMWEALNIFTATSLSSLSSFFQSHSKSISIPVYTNSCVFPMVFYALWEEMKFSLLLHSKHICWLAAVNQALDYYLEI